MFASNMTSKRLRQRSSCRMSPKGSMRPRSPLFQKRSANEPREIRVPRSEQGTSIETAVQMMGLRKRSTNGPPSTIEAPQLSGVWRTSKTQASEKRFTIREQHTTSTRCSTVRLLTNALILSTYVKVQPGSVTRTVLAVSQA